MLVTMCSNGDNNTFCTIATYNSVQQGILAISAVGLHPFVVHFPTDAAPSFNLDRFFHDFGNRSDHYDARSTVLESWLVIFIC